MSSRLAVSSAFSVLMMAAFVLFGTRPADLPFGEAAGSSPVQAAISAPGTLLRETVGGLLR